MWLIFYFSLISLFVSLNAQDPEIDMTTIQMAQYWGYTDANIVYTQTTDGYILELHHIPYGKEGQGSNGQPRPVVFLQHGLLCASDNFVWNLPNQSLAFVLADYGFDVWMGNVRGNRYSQRHATMNSTDPKFWKFSWDEMAKYDLDAMIGKVLNLTGASSLYYIGHSQGTEIMFTKLSTDTDFHTKIKAFFALAPVATVKNIQGALAYLAHNLFLEMEIMLDLLGGGPFLPASWIMDLLSETFCSQTSDKKGSIKEDGEEFCDNIFFLVGGPNTFQLNVSRTPVYTSHAPAGTSGQDVLHWMQMVLSGLQQAYDYGSAQENMNHYGSPTPPIYNISLVNAPTYLYWSDEDWLGDAQDIQNYILPNLNPAILKGNYHMTEFNHLDYIFGIRAADEIYHPIAKLIQKDFSGN